MGWRNGFESGAPGDQYHRRADIQRRVKYLTTSFPQLLDQPHVLLAATAAKTDQMHGGFRDPGNCLGESLVVNGAAIEVSARRRISLMQRQPLHDLLNAVVVE